MLNFKKEIDQWGPIDGRLLYPSFWIVANASSGTKFKAPWPTYVGVYGHDRMAYFWEKPEMQKKGEVALKRWIIPNRKLKKLWKDYSRFVAGLKELRSEAANISDFRDMTYVKSYVKRFYHDLLQLWVYALVPELANFAAPEYLRKKLRGLVPQAAIEEVVGVLIAPERLSFHQQSELELLQTALASKSRKDLLANLTVYTRKWYWVENSYYETQTLPAAYFLRQVSKLSKKQLKDKIKKILAYQNLVVKRKRHFIKKYHIPKFLAHTARSASFSIWWQDHRKATSWWAHNVIDKLNMFAADFFGIKIDDLMYYDCTEWLQLFQTGAKVDSKLLRARKKSMMVLATAKYYKFYYGGHVKKFIKSLAQKEKSETSSQIKGIIAFNPRKKITGRVKVLHSPKFASQMKNGEILVAPMTSPDYIVAMRKAKAIITDVGGLMSHAAVVSRELGVACIVGTKIATKVFKDGDLVEVDANKGVVKKVNR